MSNTDTDWPELDEFLTALQMHEASTGERSLPPPVPGVDVDVSEVAFACAGPWLPPRLAPFALWRR